MPQNAKSLLSPVFGEVSGSVDKRSLCRHHVTGNASDFPIQSQFCVHLQLCLLNISVHTNVTDSPRGEGIFWSSYAVNDHGHRWFRHQAIMNQWWLFDKLQWNANKIRYICKCCLQNVVNFVNALINSTQLNSNRFIVASNIHRRKIWHEDNEGHWSGSLIWPSMCQISVLEFKSHVLFT